MNNKIDIQAGKILIAEPYMNETTFGRTVIGICDHTADDGTVGFILNRPINVKIEELIPDIKTEVNFRVNYGGPVATDTIHYIHNIGDLLEGSVQVTDGVYWSGDFEKLKFLINSGLVKSDNLIFYIGYSGWSAGQLMDELVHHKSWLVSDLDPNYVFKSEPKELWKESLDHKGKQYSVIAQIPKNNNLN